MKTYVKLHSLFTFLLIVFLSANGHAGSRPFDFWKKGDNIKTFCTTFKDIYKFGRTRQIGKVHLSIGNLDYGSGDAERLGVFFAKEEFDVGRGRNAETA